MIPTCRSCRAPIMWCETEAIDKKPARRMPLDANKEGEPLVIPNGNIAIVGSTPTGTPRVRYVKQGSGKYQSHFASCSTPERHRKPIKKANKR